MYNPLANHTFSSYHYMSVLVVGWWERRVVRPQVNKFEQVSSDDQQMSLVGLRVCPEWGRVCQGYPHVTYPMMHVVLPIPL